jgi:hypothetical protein
MGLRFPRTVTLLPGVRLNLGLHGARVSVGRRGASLTFGPHGTYGNVGLPGTGLAYRTRLSPSRTSAAVASRGHASPDPAVAPASIGEDGTCEIQLADGSVPDAECCKAIWARDGEAIGQALAAEVADAQATWKAITDIHLATPSSTRIPAHTPKPFDVPMPSAPAAPGPARGSPAPGRAWLRPLHSAVQSDTPPPRGRGAKASGRARTRPGRMESTYACSAKRACESL